MNGQPPSAVPGEPAEALLEVRELRTWFQTDRGLFRAVDGISFDVAATISGARPGPTPSSARCS